MTTFRLRTALRLSILLVMGTVVLTQTAFGFPHTRKHGKAGPKTKAGGTKGAVLAVVEQWEQAYKRKDKQTLLMRLMVPTTDLAALEKRYQWLRGYGPKDMPGTKHPPILFETSRGSFVPTGYKVMSAAPAENGRWDVVVREEGTYRDEDGTYDVVRVRQIKLTSYKGKWYVMDYTIKENPEDYGFYVDDIIDRMKKR